jgi:hypothetical protein
MSNNFVNSQKPQYRTPTKLSGDWDYVGQQGKLNDPIIGHPAMHGRRWMIDYGYGSGKSFEKFQQGLKK